MTSEAKTRLRMTRVIAINSWMLMAVAVFAERSDLQILQPFLGISVDYLPSVLWLTGLLLQLVAIASQPKVSDWLVSLVFGGEAEPKKPVAD